MEKKKKEKLSEQSRMEKNLLTGKINKTKESIQHLYKHIRSLKENNNPNGVDKYGVKKKYQLVKLEKKVMNLKAEICKLSKLVYFIDKADPRRDKLANPLTKKEILAKKEKDEDEQSIKDKKYIKLRVAAKLEKAEKKRLKEKEKRRQSKANKEEKDG